MTCAAHSTTLHHSVPHRSPINIRSDSICRWSYLQRQTNSGDTLYKQQKINYFENNPELFFLCEESFRTPKYEVAGTYFEDYLQHKYYMTQPHINQSNMLTGMWVRSPCLNFDNLILFSSMYVFQSHARAHISQIDAPFEWVHSPVDRAHCWKHGLLSHMLWATSNLNPQPYMCNAGAIQTSVVYTPAIILPLWTCKSFSPEVNISTAWMCWWLCWTLAGIYVLSLEQFKPSKCERMFTTAAQLLTQVLLLCDTKFFSILKHPLQPHPACSVVITV